jgi:glycosyltransferase involved in cell wall biosynthesis
MRPEPLVSVVLPVRNGAEYLGACLDSLRRQTLTDFEVIVVENGSTDSAPAIIADFVDLDVRFRMVRIGAVGLVAALNCGLTLARGEFVARMDGDDVAMPGRLAAQVAALEADESVGVIGSMHRYIDSSGSQVGSIRRLPTRPSAVEAELLLSNPLAHPTVMFAPRRLSEPIEYSDEFPDAEDLELWLRLRRHTKLANLGEPLLDRREHSESVMAVGRDRGAASCMRAFEIHTRSMTARRFQHVFNASSGSVRLWDHVVGLAAVNMTNLRYGDVPRVALGARSVRAFAVHLVRRLRCVEVFRRR